MELNNDLILENIFGEVQKYIRLLSLFHVSKRKFFSIHFFYKEYYLDGKTLRQEIRIVKDLAGNSKK